MKRRSPVIVVVNVELHAVTVKVACILHGVFRAVHNDFRPHRHERIIGVHGDGVICRRINAAGRRTAGPSAAADRAVAVAARNDLSEGFANAHLLCLRHRFCSVTGRVFILRLKDLPERPLDFLPRVILIKNSQESRQLIGVVVDLTGVDFIFVVIRILLLDLQDSFTKLRFQRTVVSLRPSDILIGSSK